MDSRTLAEFASPLGDGQEHYPYEHRISLGVFPDKEENKYVGQFKRARLDKWSVTSGKGLGEIQSLAIWLLALGRLDETIQIGRFMADHLVFKGNWDKWTFAGGCLAIPGHAAWLKRDTVTSDLLFAKAAPYPLFENAPVFTTLPVKQSETSRPFLTVAAIQYVFEFEAGRRGIDIGSIPMEHAEGEVERVLGQLKSALT